MKDYYDGMDSDPHFYKHIKTCCLAKAHDKKASKLHLATPEPPSATR